MDTVLNHIVVPIFFLILAIVAVFAPKRAAQLAHSVLDV